MMEAPNIVFPRPKKDVVTPVKPKPEEPQSLIGLITTQNPNKIGPKISFGIMVKF